MAHWDGIHYRKIGQVFAETFLSHLNMLKIILNLKIIINTS
jgi:hypothetical protein